MDSSVVLGLDEIATAAEPSLWTETLADAASDSSSFATCDSPDLLMLSQTDMLATSSDNETRASTAENGSHNSSRPDISTGNTPQKPGYKVSTMLPNDPPQTTRAPPAQDPGKLIDDTESSVTPLAARSSHLLDGFDPLAPTRQQHADWMINFESPDAPAARKRYAYSHTGSSSYSFVTLACLSCILVSFKKLCAYPSRG